VLWIPLAFLFDGVTVLLLPIRLGGDATTASTGAMDADPGSARREAGLDGVVDSGGR
jgi:hypothetical protein